ncbi:aldo/keto reductase [Paenibacillus daejeonensis]|uniref:aldo/keto reductase n=1 Tax=Paenibacillus daejeonensis TaxID=135193 RepID=UPI00037B29D6|nr:aldo/keto reductase [Paenibacillus daejeonensis]
MTITISSLKDTVTLNNGVQMPRLGFGVFKVKEGEEVVDAVKAALAAGYRAIDTAAAYQNEEGVGQAIRESGIPREELFITTKVWNSRQGYDSTLEAFEESRRKLGLDYLDLYLIHWPVKGKYKDTWRALEKLYSDGVVRAIGVSNFQTHHLDDIFEDNTIVPAVNQIEYSPLLTQEKVKGYCEEKGIHITAWSPLMQGNLDLPLLQELSAKYGKTPAQIVIRWDLQKGVLTIPKSVTPSRIKENADVYDFELSAEDVAAIDGLNQNRRYGSDPDNFNF